MAHEVLHERREDRKKSHSEGKKVTKNVKGLLEALRQSINEAVLESNDVAAAMAALKGTAMCPAFKIDISLEEAPAGELPSTRQNEALGRDEELVLSDQDVEFLAALGITDPSWCCTTPNLVRHSTK
jgi:hypothetical protein